MAILTPTIPPIQDGDSGLSVRTSLNKVLTTYGYDNVFISGSHAEGAATQAIGSASHAEGEQTQAIGDASHAEGRLTQAIGSYSHAEGYSTQATGDYSHAEGEGTQAIGIYSHTEGVNAQAIGSGSHAEGDSVIALGIGSHTEGYNTLATSGNYAATYVSGGYSYYASTKTLYVADNWTDGGGYNPVGLYVAFYHSDNKQFHVGRVASASYDAVDSFTTIYFDVDPAGSDDTSATSPYGAFIQNTDDSATNHAEGFSTLAIGGDSHAEGSRTVALGEASHAEGNSTQAIGDYSHAEGDSTQAIGEASHAEGGFTQAVEYASHAEGYYTQAIGDASHAEGYYTIASGSYQHVGGTYNTHNDDTSLLIVGNGIDDSNRSDAFKVRMSGSIILPVTSSTSPTWSGVDGEMIFGDDGGGNYVIWAYLGGQWRSGSLY